MVFWQKIGARDTKEWVGIYNGFLRVVISPLLIPRLGVWRKITLNSKNPARSSPVIIHQKSSSLLPLRKLSLTHTSFNVSLSGDSISILISSFILQQSRISSFKFPLNLNHEWLWVCSYIPPPVFLCVSFNKFSNPHFNVAITHTFELSTLNSCVRSWNALKFH